MAIILSGKVLGLDLAISRSFGAIIFSIVIGLIMAYIYRKEEVEKINATMQIPETNDQRPLWKTSVFFLH